MKVAYPQGHKLKKSYIDKIIEAREKGDFIYIGTLINEARKNGTKLNQLAIALDVSIPALSHLSVIASRSTKEMRRWASQNKIGIKALREIVRMPEKYRLEIAERFVNGEVTTWIVDELKHRLNELDKQNRIIDMDKEISEILRLKMERKSRNDKQPKKAITFVQVPKKPYTISDIQKTIDILTTNITDMPFELSEWQKKGLIPRIRILKRLINDLSNRIE